MKIFLIGLPGSGKTTLGKQLALKLNLVFIDLDKEIEKTQEQTITEIFEKKKEDYFREVESVLLTRYCVSSEKFVMATGGGTPCFHNNMTVMNQYGKTIFLDVPAKEIADRLLKTDLTERPLLAKMTTEVLKDKIEFLRSQRIGFYKLASFTFTGSEVMVQEIIETIA